MGLGRGWARNRVEKPSRHPVPGTGDRRGCSSEFPAKGAGNSWQSRQSPEGETSMSHCFDCALLIVRNLTKSGAKKVRQVRLTSPPVAVGGGRNVSAPLDFMLRHGGVSVACWRRGWILLGYCWRVT